MWLMFIGLSVWVTANVEGLIQMNRLSMYVLLLMLLFLAAFILSYRTWSWIKDGKI